MYKVFKMATDVSNLNLKNNTCVLTGLLIFHAHMSKTLRASYTEFIWWLGTDSIKSSIKLSSALVIFAVK